MKIPRPLIDWSRVCRLAAVLWSFAGLLHAQNFTGYDYIVPKGALPNDVTIVDGTGVTLPVNRSYVIGIDGGTRNPIEFRNWTGTPEYPIVVVNRPGNGRVTISDLVPGNPNATRRHGIFVEHCKYMQLRGDNDPAHRYGIEIARAGGAGSGAGQRGIEVTGRSSDVEIMFFEIKNAAFAGIMVKQDPLCGVANAWTWHPTLVYRNISIHDNYLHDIGAEALYVGFSFWTDDRCPTETGPYEGFAHNIEGLRVYNNLVERCAWDGIQIGAATSDVEVFNNVIVDAGLGGSGTQSGDTGVGVQLGGGTTGLFYNNVIINSRNNGIAMFGIGHNIIFNNLVYGGKVGIFLDSRPDGPSPSLPADRQTQAGTPYYVFNNTFITPSSHVMWTMSDITDNQFNNNIAVADEPAVDHNFIRYDAGATGTDAGNVFQRTTTGLDFADPANYDFRILNTSTAVDQGVSLAQVPADFLGLPRGQGAAYDAGYSEAGQFSVYLVATPPSSGSNGMITASAINGTPPYSYAWSNGATTATISSLPPGLYSVTVSDAASAVIKRATYLFTGAEMGAPVGLTPPTQVETPLFTAPAGTYSTSQAVTISTVTAGATIRYTTNGTTPTATTGTVYTVPVAVNSTGTLKAIAYKAGLANSKVAVATYFIGTPPAAPTLTVTSASDRRIQISWTASPGANRYELKYATTSGGPYTTSLGVLTTTSFTHNGLTNGTTYYYVVEAGNLYGISSASAQATGTPFPYPGTIGVLTGFTAGPTTTSSVAATGAFNAQPTWNSSTQTPAGDDPTPHSNTTTTTANRFWAVDFTASYGTFHITEMWTRYRPSSSGNRPGFAALWWDNDKDATNDGVPATGLNFQTAQGMPSLSSQLWIRDRDFGPDPVTPLNQYLVLSTGTTTTDRPNEFAFIGWKDGSPTAPTIVQQPIAQTVPVNSSVMFTVGATGSPAPAYQWKKNGVAIVGATRPLHIINTVQASDAGNYSVEVSNASGTVTSTNAALAVSSPALTILTPLAVGTATGSLSCTAAGAFNEQPTWDAVAGTPVGIAAAPHASTTTAYANRHWYIDFGVDFAKVRIAQMWTRYRPSSAGNHPGFAMMWWDNDKDTTNDGVTAATMNFNTAQGMPNSSSQFWLRDRDFTATPITPQERYLVVSTGAGPDDRPNEFAFVGYVVP